MEKKRNKKKQMGFTSFFICVCIVFGLGFVVHAETNPISITATKVENGTFTVVVSATAGTDMQAFKILIGYDADKVNIVGEKGKAYGFTNAFISSYNSDSSAAHIYNNVVNGKDSHLVYAGAQANSNLALIKQRTDLCFVQFQLLADSENALSEAGIYLKVEQLKGSNGDLVERYPDAFTDIKIATNEEPITATENSVSAGEAEYYEWRGNEDVLRKPGNQNVEENAIISNNNNSEVSSGATVDKLQTEQNALTGGSLNPGQQISTSGENSMKEEISGEGNEAISDVTGDSITGTAHPEQDNTNQKNENSNLKLTEKSKLGFEIIAFTAVVIVIVAALAYIGKKNNWKRKKKV